MECSFEDALGTLIQHYQNKEPDAQLLEALDFYVEMLEAKIDQQAGLQHEKPQPSPRIA